MVEGEHGKLSLRHRVQRRSRSVNEFTRDFATTMSPIIKLVMEELNTTFMATRKGTSRLSLSDPFTESSLHTKKLQRS
jgi:hypothetical protein